MAELPPTYAAEAGFVPASPGDVWEFVRDIENWPRVFPGWVASVVAGDDRFTGTGPAREKFDLYPHSDPELRSLDVEVVDELGSADTLKLRLLDMPGGTLVLVAHGRLSGTSDASWESKRAGIAAGLSELSID
jgi:hypothetical protein